MDKLLLYFSYPFVWYALIVGVLIALCSSFLGVTLVLKHYSLVGDSLSHVAFCAMAVASVMHFTNNILLVLPITIACATLMLRNGNKKVKGDALVAMVSVGSLAIGYLVMSIFGSSTNMSADVCSTLFGSTSILTLKPVDVVVCIILSIFVVATYILLYNKIFAVTFDEKFSKAAGVNTACYNTLVAVIIAVVIVLAMNLVGSLLISALIIFPAMCAMKVFKNFKAVIVCSAITSVVCASTGILTAVLAGTPVGSTIVTIDIVAYIIFSLIGRVRR